MLVNETIHTTNDITFSQGINTNEIPDDIITELIELSLLYLSIKITNDNETFIASDLLLRLNHLLDSFIVGNNTATNKILSDYLEILRLDIQTLYSSK